jgi:hypothetical protein
MNRSRFCAPSFARATFFFAGAAKACCNLIAVVDQAHAGDSGLGFRELGDVDFDDLKPAVAQPPGGSSTASGSTPANSAGSTEASWYSSTAFPAA